MGRVIILGTASAVPDEHQENSHLIVLSSNRVALVDCPGNPIVQLKRAGISHNRVTDIILTHFHPDHVSGFTLLTMDFWLLGREQELHVWGLEHTIERAEKMMELYGWQDWPNFYPLTFHRLPDEEQFLFIDDPSLHAYSSPTKHLIPSIGVRFVFPEQRKIAVYSSDTEPTDVMVRLASGADALIHEATGASFGHSSAEQAGEIAERAKAASLYLIHYVGGESAGSLVPQAKKQFSGPVYLTRDLMEIYMDEESPTDQEGLPLRVFP